MSEWTHNKDKDAAREALAQEAMALIEQAEQLEVQEQWAKAAYTYQQAAEKLQRSGFATHFISDIYSKATDCNSRAKPAKIAGGKTRNQQPSKVSLQQVGSFQQQANSSQQQVASGDQQIKISKQSVESLQKYALSLIEIAKNLEKEKRYGDALEKYLSAVNLLTEAGWKPEQLENIKTEITHLQQLMASGS